MFRGLHSGDNRHLWIVPLAAFLTVLPLILHGGSCGHDLLFHVQSWIDAAVQLRHGTYPRWATTPAWNAGEPRFLFYPPITWLLGALLTLLVPLSATPGLFLFIALSASGLTFHHLARGILGTSPASANAALIASALYLANPYMLFCAFERSALAELLAAAWIPLLLLAALRPRPTVRSLALPICLLWLTNAPAAVIGCYALALLATLRILFSTATKILPLKRRQATSCESPNAKQPIPQPERSVAERMDPSSSLHPASFPGLFPPQTPSTLRLALTCILGTLLGFALPAFYLIPAAYQRRFVQISMAILPGLRPEDSFLFAHTSDAAHNAVNHTASLIALTLLSLTAAALGVLWIQNRTRRARIPLPTQATHLHLAHKPTPTPPATTPAYLLPILAVLTVTIALLLTPLSTPIWQHLPELAFLQFPWRLLTLLTPLLALTIALLLSPRAVQLSPSAQDSDRVQGWSSRPEGSAVERPAVPPAAIPGVPHSARLHAPKLGITLALALPLALSLLCFHLYSQPCDAADTPAALAHLLATHHGTLPTDEYTPTDADNNLLRSDNPAFWLILQTEPQAADPDAPNQTAADPNIPAPHTLPTAAQLNPAIDTDDTPIPLSQTVSTPAPRHLTLNLARPSILVLNLRDYPSWRVTNLNAAELPIHLPRIDGLIAINLPAGPATIDIAWSNTADQILGIALSVLALLALIAPTAARRRDRRSGASDQVA